MVGIQNITDVVNTHVLGAIKAANNARKEAEEDMHAALEVANFRAREIQQEYEASFSEKKSKAMKEIRKLQDELNQENVKQVQDYLIEQIEQALSVVQDQLENEAVVFEHNIRLPMDYLVQQL